MASPATFEVARATFGPVVHNTTIKFGKLYLRQIHAGTGANQSDVIQPNAATGLGQTAVNNWGIYDGVGSGANLVAYGQGMHTFAGNWQNFFTMMFEMPRFKGSTLQIMGASVEKASDWAIVGGTGDFAMAQGVIKRTEYSFTADGKIHEISIDGYCHVDLPPVPKPTRMGPWGAPGGYHNGLKDEKSRRMESVTIYYTNAVNKLSFTYAGEDGMIRTAGPWGYHSDQLDFSPLQQTTITFGPSEFVTGLSGTSLQNILSGLKIVTNVTTYGPFGTGTGTTPFNATVPVGKTAVGFFVQSDNSLIAKIGLYII